MHALGGDCTIHIKSFTYYAGIMLDAFLYLLCSKLCIIGLGLTHIPTFVDKAIPRNQLVHALKQYNNCNTTMYKENIATKDNYIEITIKVKLHY